MFDRKVNRHLERMNHLHSMKMVSVHEMVSVHISMLYRQRLLDGVVNNLLKDDGV